MPGPDAMAWVPGATRGARPQVRALTGGLTNRSFLVTTDEGRFVVRLGTVHDELLAIDRRVESTVQRLAAHVGVAPDIVHADAASGLLVTRYVEGRGWAGADFADPAGIDRLCAQLASLQSIEVRAAQGIGRLEPIALARAYVERILAAAPGEKAQLEALLGQAGRRSRDTGASARRPVLVHSDLHGSNLVDGERLWLIDWEYAALADPLHDLACLLAYHPQAAPHVARMLAALGLGRAVTAQMLDASVWLFQLLVFLWYRARRVAVAPTALEQAAEARAARALGPLMHNRSL
jgi:thiamine kinase